MALVSKNSKSLKKENSKEARILLPCVYKYVPYHILLYSMYICDCLVLTFTTSRDRDRSGGGER